MNAFEHAELEEQAAAAVKQVISSPQLPPRDTFERGVKRAELMVDYFTDDGESGGTRLSDILTDLIHWAHHNDVDFLETLSQATGMVHQERDDWGMAKLDHI